MFWGAEQKSQRFCVFKSQRFRDAKKLNLGDENSARSFPDRSFFEPPWVMDVHAFGSWTSMTPVLVSPGFLGLDRSFCPPDVRRDIRVDVRRISGPKTYSLGYFFVLENRGVCKPGGFPLFSGKVQIVSRTLSGLFLVGALNGPRKREGTNRENPWTIPEQIGKIPEKSGKSQTGQKRTKKEGQNPDREAPRPPFETPPFSGSWTVRSGSNRTDSQRLKIARFESQPQSSVRFAVMSLLLLQRIFSNRAIR